ncbi:MAG: aminomethyl-transferring glycine dehydrogenase subunit GcvPB [Acidobacteria bacterium]|nr:aminomethyl-transferring glycine dehydrogenase subunit GcvPB [Acidobacteriota bacterium]
MPDPVLRGDLSRVRPGAAGGCRRRGRAPGGTGLPGGGSPGHVFPRPAPRPARLRDRGEPARGNRRARRGPRGGIVKRTRLDPRPDSTLFESGGPDREGFRLPPLDVPPCDLPERDPDRFRPDIEGFPRLSEVEVVRHYTRLSKRNFGIDDGLYPLGSCSMKHNPKIGEEIAREEGFRDVHPLQPGSTVQGCLQLQWELERYLAEITGMAGFTLQPSAGAQGEFAGLLIVRARQRDRGENRSVVLIPDSAHGTNPASARLAGYRVEEIPSDSRGCIDPDRLRRRLGADVAALMLTNPNTLGIFETGIEAICAEVHACGGLVYCDGANLNAVVGISRPGDAGIDILHVNLHKTFSTPHGGGGPGAGPLGVTEDLLPYLPVPRVVREGDRFRLDSDRPRSIGRLHAFYGNFLVTLRAWAYVLANGPEGLRRVAEGAVLNANYLRALLEEDYAVAFPTRSLHEVVFSDRKLEATGVRTLDVAKRLIDYGFHPPTIYFPLIVRGAMMVEPTETETVQELEAFAAALRQIAAEARRDPERVRTAPHTAPVGRLDETGAARRPVLRWPGRG